MKQKPLNIVLKVILYLIGFPALVGLVAWKSVDVWKNGSTYGFWPFVGLILAGVFLILFTIVFIIVEVSAKKHAGNRKKVMSGIATLVVFSFVLTGGLWLIIDIPQVLPAILDDATSGTVQFDDLREDYVVHSETHGDLLTKFIEWNIENGNLDPDQSDYWYEQGYNAPEVKELIAQNFQSIDKNGYTTFKGPWLNLADGGRMTIPVLVHLILNEREYDDTIMFHLEGDRIPNPVMTDKKPDQYQKTTPRTEDDVEVNLHWSILDMAGGTMDVDLTSSIKGTAAEGYLSAAMMLSSAISDILTAIDKSIADPAVADSEIFICLDFRDGQYKVALTSAVEQRGMWDYKKSAWLNSNNLLFAVISIFPARQMLYVWGGIVIFASVAIGALDLKEFGGKKKEDDYVDETVEEERPPRHVPTPEELAAERKMMANMTPYDRAYYIASKRRNQM